MREEAKVVIVGGGAMGVGLLYHLAHEGWTDILLVEKGELTSGSTWHAAGLVPNFIGSLNMAKVHEHAIDLYARLEIETGLSAGFHRCGALRLAVTPEQVDWFHKVENALNLAGVECHLVSPSECLDIHPLMTNDDVLMGFYTPNDGWTDPTMATNAMAAGARKLGAEISKKNRVTDMSQLPDGRWEVITQKGRVVAEHVVNAAGSYGPQLGAMVGLEVPVANMIHQYLVTEAMPAVAALDKELPVLRDPKASCYYRMEHDGLIIGPYEMKDSQTYGLDGIDWELEFHLEPPSLDRLMDSLGLAADRIPAFAEAGIKQVINGPITHTPDAGYLMGPAPGLRNYWYCLGASIGITQGPGAGKYLAQWMVHGQTEINVREMDPRRFSHHAPGDYTIDRSIDEYHEMYQTRMPGEYRPAGREIMTNPIYETLKAKGAIFAENYNWERPKWFDTAGEGEIYSFRRSNSFSPVGEECRAVRDGVGVADITGFAKIDVTGPDAAAFLERMSANRIPSTDHGVRLVHMLTDLAGIESEMTITRLGPDRFFLLSSIVAEQHDYDWLVQHVGTGEDVTVADVTEQYAALAVAGPRSREVLATLTDADLSNERFPWLTAAEIEVAGVPCRAIRVSYVGELGWELYHPMDRMAELYEAIMEAGTQHGIRDFGLYAINSMRMEKAYKGWGSELTTEVTMHEAGLERFLNLDVGDFKGRQATLDMAESGSRLQIIYMELADGDNDAQGNEQIFYNGRPVGLTTSGAYGHTVGKSLAFGYVEPDLVVPGTRFEVKLLGEMRPATVLAEPAYDAENIALRG
ncbi:MAG: FAD-dependent oxidoreductase [bacterium]|nr:FAD-dependent oxidoreductase [bacterium]